MAKLTVWMSVQESDAQCYNIIAKTKKECLAKVAERSDAYLYNAPVKVDIMYKDAFDLFEYVTSENGGRHIYL